MSLQCTVLVFMYDIGICTSYWYLRTCDTSIYAQYWYLHAILVFTFNTDIYVRQWYFTWRWLLNAMLIFAYHTGMCTQCWNLCAILVFTCTLDASIDIDYSSYP